MALLEGGSQGAYQESDEEAQKWQKLIRRFRKAGISPGSGGTLPLRVKFHKLKHPHKIRGWDGAPDNPNGCMCIFRSIEPGFEGLYFFGKPGKLSLDPKAELFKVVCAAINRRLDDQEKYNPHSAVGNELIANVTLNPMDNPGEDRGGYFWNCLSYQPAPRVLDDDDDDEPAPAPPVRKSRLIPDSPDNDAPANPPRRLADAGATERQIKFIYAIAREAGLADEIEEWAEELFGIAGIEGLNRQQASDFIEQLQRRRNEVAPALPVKVLPSHLPDDDLPPGADEDEDLPEWAQR